MTYEPPAVLVVTEVGSPLIGTALPIGSPP